MIKSRQELHEYIKKNALVPFLKTYKESACSNDEYAKVSLLVTFMLATLNADLQDEIFGDIHNA